jgi:hypothetical protein
VLLPLLQVKRRPKEKDKEKENRERRREREEKCSRREEESKLFRLGEAVIRPKTGNSRQEQDEKGMKSS